MSFARIPPRVPSSFAIELLNTARKRQGVLRLRSASGMALVANVSDVPDGARTIVGDEQAAVFRNGDPYGAAPHLAVFSDETGEEVFVAAVGVTVVHGDADDFVASAVGAVPGAVFGGESVTVIRPGEPATGGVEGHLQRGHMGLNQDVRSNYF